MKTGIWKTFLAFIVGGLIIVVGIEVLSMVFRWLFSFELILNLSSINNLVSIAVLFLVTLTIYGTPFRLGVLAVAAITDRIGSMVALSVFYLVVIGIVIFSLIQTSPVTVIVALILCMVSAVGLIIAIVSETKKEQKEMEVS